MILTLLLSYIDLGTDIVVLVNFWRGDQVIWFILSLSFIVLATLVRAFLGAIPSAAAAFQPWRFLLGLIHLSPIVDVWESLKSGRKLESMLYTSLFGLALETLPQLVIQTYFVLLLGLDASLALSIFVSFFSCASLLVGLERETVALEREHAEELFATPSLGSSSSILTTLQQTLSSNSPSEERQLQVSLPLWSRYILLLACVRWGEVSSRVVLLALFAVSFPNYASVIVLVVALLLVGVARLLTWRQKGPELERDWQPWLFFLVWVIVYFDFAMVRTSHVVLKPIPYYTLRALEHVVLFACVLVRGQWAQDRTLLFCMGYVAAVSALEYSLLPILLVAAKKNTHVFQQTVHRMQTMTQL